MKKKRNSSAASSSKRDPRRSRSHPESRLRRERMKIALAGDHAGFPLKEFLKHQLNENGFEILDLGAYNEKSSDYPDFAEKIGDAVVSGIADRGILVCGSGIGACVAANKIKGVRAGLAHDNYSAHQGVEHDDMNVLCLGARVIGVAPALEITKSFLAAKFTNEVRHSRRLKKVLDIERRQ
jgi:ribose 5-phosphate isomerase B